MLGNAQSLVDKSCLISSDERVGLPSKKLGVEPSNLTNVFDPSAENFSVDSDVSSRCEKSTDETSDASIITYFLFILILSIS